VGEQRLSWDQAIRKIKRTVLTAGAAEDVFVAWIESERLRMFDGEDQITRVLSATVMSVRALTKASPRVARRLDPKQLQFDAERVSHCLKQLVEASPVKAKPENRNWFKKVAPSIKGQNGKAILGATYELYPDGIPDETKLIDAHFVKRLRPKLPEGLRTESQISDKQIVRIRRQITDILDKLDK
jgi:hypothetical protein